MLSWAYSDSTRAGGRKITFGNMKRYLTTSKMMLIGLVLGIFFWLLDSAVDSFLYKGSFFLGQLVAPSLPELWMKLFVLFSFIGFGFYAGEIISRAKRAEELSRHDREFAYDRGLSLDEFVRRSDEALYEAKNSGRNRVECYRGFKGKEVV